MMRFLIIIFPSLALLVFLNDHYSQRKSTNNSYLRNRQQHGHEEGRRSISSSEQQIHRYEEDSAQKNQRVVLLAGPHKTCSSSIQTNIDRWVFEDNYNQILPNWSWPIPQRVQDINCGKLENRPKRFYPFFGTLNGLGHVKCIRQRYEELGLKGRDLVEDYREEFRLQWKMGKNLVIGSEAMDFVVSTKHDSDLFLRKVLKSMPWETDHGLLGNNEDITVVIKYRAPRVDHLISLWHQCCMEDMTFFEYLTEHITNTDEDAIRSLDSLGMADKFLQNGEGLTVTLIDMSGVNNAGYDISDVIACDVLGASCTENKQVIGDEGVPRITNIKHHTTEMLGVSKTQLKAMENAIRIYDCNYIHLLQEKKVTFLYKMSKIFQECGDLDDDMRISSRWDLTQLLAKIAEEGETFYYSDEISTGELTL